jgi:hypothetical protein
MTPLALLLLPLLGLAAPLDLNDQKIANGTADIVKQKYVADVKSPNSDDATCMEGYKQYAFGSYRLKPISRTGQN